MLITELVNANDLTLGFIRINELNAMCSVEINNGQEYLLCFHCKLKSDDRDSGTLLFFVVVGIYVNSEGKRSRKQELLWHSTPTSIGKVVYI